MRKAAVAVAAVVVLAVAGAVAVPFAENYAARRIKAELELGGVQVEGVKVSLLERSVALDGMVGPNGEVKIGNWKAEGLGWPLSELKQGRTPLRGLTWGDPLKVAHLRLQNVRVADPDEGGAWTIRDLVATGLDLPRYDAVYEGPYRTQVLMARMLGAVSLKRLEQTEVAHVAIDETTLSAKKLVIEDYAHSVVGKLAVDGIELRSAGARGPSFTLGELRASGVDLYRQIDVASSLDWEPGTPIGRIPVVDASLSGFGGELMSRYGLSLDRITTETLRDGEDASRSRTRIEGFVLAPSLRSIEALGIRMVLQAMGLSAVRLGFDCGGTDDRARHEVRIENCKLSGPDLAEISFAARIVDADEEFWQSIDEGDAFALLGSKAALASAKLVISDMGLLQRSLRAKAALGGKQAAAERADLAEEIRRYQPPGVLITQDMTKLLDTVARFAEQGGTLTFDAAPQPALGLDKLDYLLKPGADLVNALGLKATLSR